MIQVVEGFGVGSGKSYYVVTCLLEHFRRGGTAYVVDTMRLNWNNCVEYARRRWHVELEDDQYQSFPESGITELFKHTPQGTPECPVVIIVDECQGQLNSRDWNDKGRRDLFAWACQSRHDDNDLWFISQSAANVDKQVRRLATYTWRVRNTRNWGKNIITGMLKCLKAVTFNLHSGAYFVVKQYDQDGKTEIGKARWVDQEQSIFKCYESKAMRGTHSRLGAAVNRKSLKTSSVARKRVWISRGVLVALPLLVFSGCKMIRHYRGGGEASPTPGGPSQNVQIAKSAGEYDVRSEAFHAQLGKTVLSTDKWTYEVGLMCPDGFVEVVSEGQARIKQPNGRSLFILGDRRARMPAGGVPTAAPAPSVKPTQPIIVAPDTTIRDRPPKP